MTLSQDAAIVLVLAETAVPYAAYPEAEAERWLRILRMHGQVGSALQALGVGEAPLETAAQPRAVRLSRQRPLGEDPVEMVCDHAREFAFARGTRALGTIDVLYGVLAVYGQAFDRALYLRGTTRAELLERIANLSAVQID